MGRLVLRAHRHGQRRHRFLSGAPPPRSSSGDQSHTFALLVPDAPRAGQDWTLELALPLLEDAAGGPVEGLVAGPDPFEAVKDALEQVQYDEVIVSTLPRRVSRWLRRDLPRRIEQLGVPVTTVTAPDRGESLTDTMRRVGVPGSPGMPGAVGSDVRRKPPTKH